MINNKKPWLNAIVAWLQGEVDASALEAYQRAGNIVFEQLWL